MASLIYNCHDASGRIADALSAAISLTSSGTGLSFQQAVAGSASLGISFTEAGSGSIKSVSASLPDTSATSCLLLAYLIISTPVATRIVSGLGTAGCTGEIIAFSGARHRRRGRQPTALATRQPTRAQWVTQVNRSVTPAVFLFTDQTSARADVRERRRKQCAFAVRDCNVAGHDESTTGCGSPGRVNAELTTSADQDVAANPQVGTATAELT